ncbi:MAG: hypothetical protein WCY34_03055 [Candidatus Omnitrophota bacterium]|jgi:hypothetical protein
MKKTLVFVLPFILFIPSLLYLHQKVQIHIEAYRLSHNYFRYNELVDKRDYLRYNFSKEVSLAKVNQWAQLEDFSPVDKERIVALGPKSQGIKKERRLASLFSRFLRASTSTSSALAENAR